MASIPTLQQAEAFVRYINASRYITYSTYCLLIYDHVLTFGDELNLVWQSRSMNSVKAMFIFNRYAVPVLLAVDVATVSGGLSSTTLKRMCRGWVVFDIIAELATLCTTTCITNMRIRNLWADRQDVDRFLNVIWVLQALVSAGLVANSLSKNTGSYSYEPSFNICFGTIHQSWMIWIPAIIYHLIVFVAMIIKALSTPRSVHTRFLSVLLLDGFMYFFVVFSAMLSNLLSWALAPGGLAHLPHYSCWAIATIAITRFLLDLQKRYHIELGPPEDDPIDEFPMKEPSWNKLDEMQASRALNDPFYSYYVAPFPMTNGSLRYPSQAILFPDDIRTDDPPNRSV